MQRKSQLHFFSIQYHFFYFIKIWKKDSLLCPKFKPLLCQRIISSKHPNCHVLRQLYQFAYSVCIYACSICQYTRIHVMYITYREGILVNIQMFNKERNDEITLIDFRYNQKHFFHIFSIFSMCSRQFSFSTSYSFKIPLKKKSSAIEGQKRDF